MQKATAREIREGLKPIRKGIEAITFPPTQPLGEEASGEEASKEEEENIGEPLDSDTKFGIRKIKDKFYIGSKEVTIDNHDIIIDDEKVEGTLGLWQLLMRERPKDYTKEDYDNYVRLMLKTNALHKNYDPNNPNPRSSHGHKWTDILSPIWANKEKYKEEGALRRKFLRESQKEMEAFDQDQYIYPEGKGVVVIPSDPYLLLERLDLLLASQKAGHTGVRNELVSICDELKRQGILDTRSYKKLNSIIKK